MNISLPVIFGARTLQPYSSAPFPHAPCGRRRGLGAITCPWTPLAFRITVTIRTSSNLYKRIARGHELTLLPSVGGIWANLKKTYFVSKLSASLFQPCCLLTDKDTHRWRRRRWQRTSHSSRQMPWRQTVDARPAPSPFLHCVVPYPPSAHSSFVPHSQAAPEEGRGRGCVD